MKSALTLAACLAWLLLAANDSQAQTTDKIRELRKEYIAAVQAAADLLTEEYNNDRRSYDELYAGKMLVFQAKLEAAETGPERVKLHEEIVKLAKEREALLVKALKMETVDMLKVLSAKADRIKAEIGLEQAKASVKQVK